MDRLLLADVDLVLDAQGHLAYRRHFNLKIGPVTTLAFLGVPPMTIQLVDNQKVLLTISGGLDAKGDPAVITDVPAWSSSVPAVAALTPSADGLSCEVVAGTPGIAQVTVTDAAGATAAVDFTIVGGPAVSFAITAGVPVTQ